MQEEWIQIGMGGVLALLVIREFSSLLKYFLDKKSISGGSRTEEGGNNSYKNPMCAECRRKIEETHNMMKEVSERKVKIEDVHTWTRELYEMHNHKDSDGVYVWYVKRSFEEAMDELAEAVNKQTSLLERVLDQYKRDMDEHRRSSK